MRKSYQMKESENLNEYFSSTVPNLGIQRPPSIILHHDPVLNAIKKLKTIHVY